MEYEPKQTEHVQDTAHEQSSWRMLAAGLAAGSVLLTGCSANSDSTEQPDPTTPAVVTAIETPTISADSSPDAEKVATQRGLNGEHFTKQPVWEQDYSAMPNGPIAPTFWKPYVGPAPANREAEYYSDSSNNVRIQDGHLILEAQAQQIDGYNYSSARLETQGIHDFQYGKFEVTATVPVGVGTWPAIWLYPTTNKYLKEHPELGYEGPYVDGEMDFMETVGTEPHDIYGIAHSFEEPADGSYYKIKHVSDSDTKPHTYGLEWTPTNLTFSIDNKVYYKLDKHSNYTFKQWPYDQPYELIANIALGGVWGGQASDRFPPSGVDPQALPATMSIDSVKYYAYTGK